MTSIMPDLIRYTANAATIPVPTNVAAKAKHHILDAFAERRRIGSTGDCSIVNNNASGLE